VRSVRDNHHTAAIVEAYQKLAPDSSICGGRTEEELAAMRLRYAPGQTITIAQPSDSEEDDFVVEDYGYDDDGGSVDTDLAIAMVALAEGRCASLHLYLQGHAKHSYCTFIAESSLHQAVPAATPETSLTIPALIPY
jgi:hypothetical protein